MRLNKVEQVSLVPATSALQITSLISLICSLSSVPYRLRISTATYRRVRVKIPPATLTARCWLYGQPRRKASHAPLRMPCPFQVSQGASPDGAECGYSSRAAHSFLEIYSSAVPVSAHLILPGAHGAQIVFAAEFVHAALPPTWERSAFRFCVLDSTTRRLSALLASQLKVG
ncbi:hypothetical protein B0H13DRAFT_751960 [Mycena leptocephala]|nr:hypothetical protein B0H13DRAFT_751960 [Mycena leptocephala]